MLLQYCGPLIVRGALSLLSPRLSFPICKVGSLNRPLVIKFRFSLVLLFARGAT